MPAQARLNGEVTDDFGITVDQRGFEWGTISGEYSYSHVDTGTFGIGTFSHLVQGLSVGVTYFFRAKAHNSVGWSYGTQMSFTTPSPSVRIWQTTTSSMALVPYHIFRRGMKWLLILTR